MDDDEERIVETQRYKYVTGQNGQSLPPSRRFSFTLSSSFLVTIEQKFGEGAGPMRSLEDEGFFVGKKPVVPVKLVQRAEQRIIQEHQLEKKVRYGNSPPRSSSSFDSISVA